MFLAQVGHDGAEEILVVLITPTALHQDVQLGDHLVLHILEVALNIKKKHYFTNYQSFHRFFMQLYWYAKCGPRANQLTVDRTSLVARGPDLVDP